MMIEVVHVNGRYLPDEERHDVPAQASGGYYRRLAGVLRIARIFGSEILYRQNCGDAPDDFWTDPAALLRMKETDPLLAELGDGMVTTAADGFMPFSHTKRLNTLEDETLRRAHYAVVLGAYRMLCVPAIAMNIASRNPGCEVSIDPMLSIDNGAAPTYLHHSIHTTSLENRFPLPIRRNMLYRQATP